MTQIPPRPSACTVRPVNGNCYRIIPERGYVVTVFTRPDRSAEAHVSNGDVTVAFNIEKPNDQQILKFKACDDRAVEIIYETVPPQYDEEARG